MGVQLGVICGEGGGKTVLGVWRGVVCEGGRGLSIQTGVHGVHGKQTCENRVLNWCVSPVSEQSES